MHQELSRELAAPNALLPAVLEQGSRHYPDKLTLHRKLENLYGSDLGADIIKMGERHILAFTFESPHGKYLGENNGLLEKGLALLGAVVGDPLLVDGGFNKKYVEQEKVQIIKDIRALLNEKSAYALERCTSVMCDSERFGTYKLGRVEDYRHIEPGALYAYYRDLLAANPLELYLVGDLDEGRVLEAVNEVFGFKRQAAPVRLPATEIGPPVGEARFVEERMNVNQAKLVLGYRTCTVYGDEDYFALLLYNGILGAFPHSKLFLKVREEAGLAYYAQSRLEKHKGLLFIMAGIDDAVYGQAREIIDRQVEDMAAGKISDTELNNTKSGLANMLRSQQDSPSKLIGFLLDGSVGGRTYTVPEIIEGLEAVSREDIRRVAEKITLDTVYLLRPREGGS